MRTLRPLDFLARLRSDERGNSLIELGLMAPFLGLLVAGITDLGQGLAARFQLQQAVNRGLEMLLSEPPEAAYNASAIDYSYIKTEAAVAAGPGSTATLEQWRECDGTKAAFVGTCADGQETARYVRLRITKNYTGSMFLDTVEMKASGAIRVQ